MTKTKLDVQMTDKDPLSFLKTYEEPDYITHYSRFIDVNEDAFRKMRNKAIIRTWAAARENDKNKA